MSGSSEFVSSQGLCLLHFQLSCELKLANTPGDWLSPLRRAQLLCLQRLESSLGN